MHLQPINALKTFFGYNAVLSKTARKRPRVSLMSEDLELNSQNRRKLVATAKDQLRNISLVGWMFRKHLDYVTDFTFHGMNEDQKLNQQLELLWRDFSRKENCDIAGRHNFGRMIRLFEASKVIDGDAGLLKLSNGKLQGIEGSRIAKPDSFPNNINSDNISDHGLVLDKVGYAKKYCIVRIENGRKVFDRLVDAKDILFDGYFVRFDQTRGVSPFAPAMNTFQDLYESWEYQLIKAKLHALLGVVITSESTTNEGSGWTEKDMRTGESPTSETIRNGYEFEIKAGAMKLELNPGDKVETIESKTPSNEFRDYTELMVKSAMYSLDIPYSYYDSSKTSFSTSKRDINDFEKSTKPKQNALRDVLIAVAVWKHEQWIREGLLPKMNPLEIKYDFRSGGRPWLEELKEIEATIKRVDAGLSSRQREAKKRGEDWFEIMEELEKEKEIIRRSGVSIVSGSPGQATIEERGNNADSETE